MKTFAFTSLYVFSFVLLFVLALHHFTTTILAVSRNDTFLNKEDLLAIQDCQQWTTRTRSFHYSPQERANEIPVLLYHQIIAQDDLQPIHFQKVKHSIRTLKEHAAHETLIPTVTTKEMFAKQMKILHDHGYTTLTLAELHEFLQGKLTIPPKSIVITFDDGFKNNAELAYPILKKYGFTAVNFLITGHISTKNTPYDATEVQYMTTQDIANTCDTFDFESHTFALHHLEKNGDSYVVSKEAHTVKHDIKTSFRQLQSTKAFAYPYGIYDQRTLALLEQADAQLAFTTEPIKARPGVSLLEIPRIEIFGADTPEHFREKIGIPNIGPSLQETH